MNYGSPFHWATSMNSLINNNISSSVSSWCCWLMNNCAVDWWITDKVIVFLSLKNFIKCLWNNCHHDHVFVLVIESCSPRVSDYIEFISRVFSVSVTMASSLKAPEHFFLCVAWFSVQLGHLASPVRVVLGDRGHGNDRQASRRNQQCMQPIASARDH